MKRTETLKDTLSCRIHPQLKEELSTEAYAKGQTTSAYVEGILFNRDQITETNTVNYSEKFYLAQEEIDNLNEEYHAEVGQLNQELSNANQIVRKHHELTKHLQEWKDYATGLKEKNEQMEKRFQKLTKKLQTLENEKLQLLQKDEIEETSKEEEIYEESNHGSWKVIFGILLVAIFGGIGFFVFKKQDTIPEISHVENNNIASHGFPHLR